MNYQEIITALTGWLSCSDHHPVHRKVLGSIPSQWTCPSCRFSPQSGCIQEATDWCFSHTLISLSPLTPSTLSKISKRILRWGLKKREIIAAQRVEGIVYSSALSHVTSTWMNQGSSRFSEAHGYERKIVQWGKSHWILGIST